VSTPTRIDPDRLPAVVRDFLAAHAAHDVDAALSAYTDDAVVVDEARPHRGTAEIADWMSRAASAYTYTTELTGAARVDDAHWVVTHHLQGDFPGGTVDLDYAFTLRGDRIAALTIAP
jgi:ketosteroid isomerase-like protein